MIAQRIFRRNGAPSATALENCRAKSDDSLVDGRVPLVKDE